MSQQDLARELKELKPGKDFLVAIDSDGCAFDTMGIKQKECFCPMLIAYFGLQPVALAARECKEFADLFSKTRGANRHKTSVRILTELLPNHPMAKERNFKVPDFGHYCNWVNDPNSLLSNEGLEKALEEATDEEAKYQLKQALTWSYRVNELVTEIVKGMPPFNYVCESLEKVTQQADVIVCSATPNEALQREWAEHDIAKYTRVIAGQEMGTKTQHLGYVSDKYKADRIIMLGDAPGDMKAAKSNNLLFYPINPGHEEVSWKRFHDEAFDKFIAGEYAGKYEQGLIDEFLGYLPDTPPWEK